MFEVRPSGNADEYARSVYGIAQYFGGPLDEERTDRFSKLLPFERMHAAFEHGEIVGGAVSCARRWTPSCATSMSAKSRSQRSGRAKRPSMDALVMAWLPGPARSSWNGSGTSTRCRSSGAA